MPTMADVLDAFTTSENAKGFTVEWDYSATGEGRHLYILRSFAPDDITAVKEFRQRFFSTDTDEQWEWVKIGIVVHSGAYRHPSLPNTPIPPDEVELHWHSRM